MHLEPLPSHDLPVRRSTAVVRPDARDGRVEAWRQTVRDGGSASPRTGTRSTGQAPPDAIDLDVLWEELDGLLGEAAASSGARRVSPLRPAFADAIAAYRGASGSAGATSTSALVDALA